MGKAGSLLNCLLTNQPGKKSSVYSAGCQSPWNVTICESFMRAGMMK